MSEEIAQIEEPKKDEDVVKYDTYKRTVSQLKKTQAANAEVMEELERFRSAEKDREQKELEAKGRFQEALQLKNKELEEERSKRVAMEKDIMEAHKKNAFISKLGSDVKKDEYLNFVNFDEIPLDETGRVDEAVLESKVNWFKQEHSSLLKPVETKDAPRGSAGDSAGPKDYMEELKALKESGRMTKKSLDSLMKKHGRL